MTKDEALKQIVEFLQPVAALETHPSFEQSECIQRCVDAVEIALEALAQPAHCLDCGQKLGDANHIHTCSPQRPWVGLTDEEIDKIYEAHHNQYGECGSVDFGYERAIEAKLKEKNT